MDPVEVVLSFIIGLLVGMGFRREAETLKGLLAVIVVISLITLSIEFCQVATGLIQTSASLGQILATNPAMLNEFAKAINLYAQKAVVHIFANIVENTISGMIGYMVEQVAMLGGRFYDELIYRLA